MTEPLRILLVDDDEVDRMAVRRALRSAGLTIAAEEAGSVGEALAALNTDSYQCVLLDYNLPGGDGMRVLREARAAGNRVPIIMLTGQQDEELAVELMKAGATDYIPKGKLNPERLEQAVRSAVRLHRAERIAADAEAALRRSEERFRILHETSPDGFMTFVSARDGRGQIEDFVYDYINPAGERLVGRSAEDLLGRRMLDAFPAAREFGLFDMYVRVVETGEPAQSEVHYDSDGLNSWFRVTAARLGDGFAVSFSDITRRKLAEEERERALATRSRFYAAMSHELRTPINAILGYTDLLLAGAYGPLAESHVMGIQRTHRAAQHLLDLVNDVLDLSKLEAGKLEMLVEPTVVPELVEDLFATVRPMAEERGSELRLVQTACEHPIQTDPRRLRQILLNLLSNAIKFGRSRPVEVHCIRTAEGGVAVAVADQGQGIAPDDLPRVFEEFVQLSPETERGTGLGLPISKRFAELLGGRLEVESTLGEGSTFRVVLPVAAPTTPVTPVLEPR